MLSFEFTVPGPPVSHQSRNKAKLAAWRQMVRRAASERWGKVAPLSVSLRITISYYHKGLAVRIDNDNMAKPIQDALIGLVYQDDRLITDTIVRKTSIDGAFYVRGYSLLLLEALSIGEEFLHIVIAEAPNHANPLR
jgi:Holliday junction resolvase RusA-like endonuclease